MSNEQSKIKSSLRRYKNETAVARQIKIAKQHGILKETILLQPHRLEKHHALDCGNPKCFICGNPRKTHKDKLTAQEHKLYQNLDEVRNTHTNGLPNIDDDTQIN